MFWLYVIAAFTIGLFIGVVAALWGCFMSGMTVEPMPSRDPAHD